ncbi:hypothetical protein [Natrinema salaciae]|nr:hypothetical protein [Natrinema salaciae]
MKYGEKVAVAGVAAVLIAGTVFVGMLGFGLSQDDGSTEPSTTTASQPAESNASDGDTSENGTTDADDTPKPDDSSDDSPTDNESTDTGTDGGEDDTSGDGGEDSDDGPGTGSDGGDDGGDDGNDDGGESEAAIAVESADIDSGERNDVALTLESAPDGMSGFRSTIGVDTGVTTIENATLAGDFDDISNVSVADDGSSVTVEAVDVGKTVEPGTTDVRLATLTIEGVEPGTTSLRLTSERFQDDDGYRRDVSTTDGEVDVKSTGAAER